MARCRRKSAEACGYLKEIQSIIESNDQLKERNAELNNLKSQAGCTKLEAPPEEKPKVQPPPPPPPPEDKQKAEYEKATSLMNGGDYEGALAAFKRIQAAEPGYKDVGALMEKCSQEVARFKKMGQDARFAELSERANKLLAAGDLRAAMKCLGQLEALRPADPGLKNLRQQITDARQKEQGELEKAVADFYSGNYDQAYKSLTDFLARPHAPRLISFARFYAGAALGSQYYLSGAKDENSKSAAIQMFQSAAKGDSAYSPRWDAISPKIKDLYDIAKK